MTPRPILIIERDATLRATLAEQIALEGSFTAVGAESAAEATAKPDLNSAHAQLLEKARINQANGDL